MPNCPKCERPMATVLKREGGHTRTHYQCSACAARLSETQEEKDTS